MTGQSQSRETPKLALPYRTHDEAGYLIPKRYRNLAAGVRAVPSGDWAADGRPSMTITRGVQKSGRSYVFCYTDAVASGKVFDAALFMRYVEAGDMTLLPPEPETVHIKLSGNMVALDLDETGHVPDPDDDEPAPTPDCPACGGPTYLLGCLGKFANYRCRDCGTDCRDLACDLCGEPLTPAQYEAGEVDYAAGRTFHHGCQLDEAAHAAEQKAEIDAENAWLREAEGLNRLPDADDEHERELEANDPFLQYLEQGRHESIAAAGGGHDPLTGEYIPAAEPRKVRGFRLTIYRPAGLGDCTNGGVSATATSVVVPSGEKCGKELNLPEWTIGPDTCVLHFRTDGPLNVLADSTDEKDAQVLSGELVGPMPGGNYAGTSDSRWNDFLEGWGIARGTLLAIYDRYETPEQNEALSR